MALALAATITAHPLANDDFLEPSVRNEVDHALDVARAALAARGTNATCAASTRAPCEIWPFTTNGTSRTGIAIRIVSNQQDDGRWTCGTNDVTAAAIELLESL